MLKLLWAVPCLFAASFSLCHKNVPAKTDAEMAAKIVGTWISSTREDGSYLEKTYRADGTSEGFIVDRFEGRDYRIDFTSRWEIKGGYFKGEILTTSDPDLLPRGMSYSDKIIRITDQEFVTLEEGYTRETVKRRKSSFHLF